MKANKFFFVLCTLPLCTFFSCKPQDITYDHEQPQFETRTNAILIEFIAPTGTAVDDELFIFGAFNGLDEEHAIEHLEWKLEKAQLSDKKWGIYLFPNDFVTGKTLLDGFSFVSKKAGGERDINGRPVTHTLDVSLGTRTNVWADRWAAYFSGEGERITHDGYVVYVWDESGFEDLCLYMYGDVNDLNGGWPGMRPTGTETVNGTAFAYFDMGADNNGLTETLIFSDNGANQLADYGPVSFDGENLILHILADGSIEKMDGSSTTEHDGAVVYVLDGLNWGMATTLYMWGDVNNLNGGWPGMSVGGTASFGAYTYMYFDMGAANAGLNEHLIFSNNGASQLPDYDGYALDHDLYLYLGEGAVTQIEDPANPGDVVWYDPQVAPREEAVISLYLYNATDSIVPAALYAWGSAEALGAWPGRPLAQMDSVAVLGLPLLHTTISGHVGDTYHLIVNGKDTLGVDVQLPDYDLLAPEVTNEYYLKVSDTGVTPLEVKAMVKGEK